MFPGKQEKYIFIMKLFINVRQIPSYRRDLDIPLQTTNMLFIFFFLSSTTYFLNDKKVGNPGRPGRRIKLALVIIFQTFFRARTEIRRNIFSTYQI